MKTLRKEALIELQSAINGIINRLDPFQSCLTCLYFDEPNELCKLYKKRPPARIIVNGCSSYDDVSEVPF